jgi:KDO2-lipid IV(A) lauroyltransferase
MNDAVEQLVREYPAQYQWGYQRFKTRPAGEAPFYRN